MKNRTWLRGFLALSMAVGLASPPREAHAIAGIATGLIPVAVVGGVLIAAGASLAIGLRVDTSSCSGLYCGLAEVVIDLLVALPLAIAGLIMLDESGQSRPNFTAINEAEALQLRITAEQAEIFNSEIEELNAARETVEAAVDPQDPRVGETIVKEWKEILKDFAPETAQVLKAIGEQRAS